MGVIRGLLDRIVLLLGVVVAGCVPSFIAQYRQRAGGRLEQVLADLAPFQQIADHEHGGSLAELVHHHLQSSDPTFHGEGAAVQSMLDSADHLRALLQGLNTDLFHQGVYLLFHGDLESGALDLERVSAGIRPHPAERRLRADRRRVAMAAVSGAVARRGAAAAPGSGRPTPAARQRPTCLNCHATT